MSASTSTQCKLRLSGLLFLVTWVSSLRIIRPHHVHDNPACVRTQLGRLRVTFATPPKVSTFIIVCLFWYILLLLAFESGLFYTSYWRSQSQMRAAMFFLDSISTFSFLWHVVCKRYSRSAQHYFMGLIVAPPIGT